MLDQEQEHKQMLIEAKIRTKLEELYSLIMEWDGEGCPELYEEMAGYVAEWKESYPYTQALDEADTGEDSNE